MRYAVERFVVRQSGQSVKPANYKLNQFAFLWFVPPQRFQFLEILDAILNSYCRHLMVCSRNFLFEIPSENVFKILLPMTRNPKEQRFASLLVRRMCARCVTFLFSCLLLLPSPIRAISSGITIDGIEAVHDHCFLVGNSTGLHATVEQSKISTTVIWDPDAPECIENAETSFSGGFIHYAGGVEHPMNPMSGSPVHYYTAGTFTVAQTDALKAAVNSCSSLPESSATEEESGGSDQGTYSVTWRIANHARGGSCDVVLDHSDASILGIVNNWVILGAASVFFFCV